MKPTYTNSSAARLAVAEALAMLDSTTRAHRRLGRTRAGAVLIDVRPELVALCDEFSLPGRRVSRGAVRLADEACRKMQRGLDLAVLELRREK